MGSMKTPTTAPSGRVHYLNLTCKAGNAKRSLR